AFQTFDGGADADVRPHAVSPRQGAGAHRMMHRLDQRVSAPLLGRPPIVSAEGLGQRVDRRLESRPARGIKPSVEAVYAARGLADIEGTQLVRSEEHTSELQSRFE